MIDTPVSVGCGRAEIEGTVEYSVEPILIAGEEGLIGVAGRLWSLYQAKTNGNGY